MMLVHLLLLRGAGRDCQHGCGKGHPEYILNDMFHCISYLIGEGFIIEMASLIL